MSKKKNTNTEEILEHSNQLLSDETIDTEQEKKEALLPEYEHMLFYASDDKNKDIILKGYAISQILEFFLKTNAMRKFIIRFLRNFLFMTRS